MAVWHQGRQGGISNLFTQAYRQSWARRGAACKDRARVQTSGSFLPVLFTTSVRLQTERSERNLINRSLNEAVTTLPCLHFYIKKCDQNGAKSSFHAGKKDFKELKSFDCYSILRKETDHNLEQGTIKLIKVLSAEASSPRAQTAALSCAQ